MSINNQNSKIIFGLKVKQLRAEKQLSSAALAELAGLSVSYLNEIEKGKKKPRKDKISQLADVLNCTYDELVSSDIVGSSAPSIFDSKATITDKETIVVYVWYDNEYGYSHQVIRLAKHIAKVRRYTYY